MDDRDPNLNDDVAFLRALAQGHAPSTTREGATLIAIGLIFGLVAIQYWLIDLRIIKVSAATGTWLWLDGLIPFLIALWVISAKHRGQYPGPVSRALSATWKSVGAAFIVADVALFAASRELGIPLLVKWVFPLVVFALMGGAWTVVFAVRRRFFPALIALGNFAAAIVAGTLIGTSQEWLVLAVGLPLLVAVPGGVMLYAQSDR